MIAHRSLRLVAAPGPEAKNNRTGEMSDADAASFNTVRPRLLGIASRVLGNATEADDVVQDTWIRWQTTDRSEVRDPTAFLATTTTRLALNIVQSARARHETYIEPQLVDSIARKANPSLAAEQGEALESAVRVLLEKLTPTERAVYVLREAFDYPYRQISELVALSEANARQHVTRARRRLSLAHRRPTDATTHRRLLDAFNAAQLGDVPTLERLLAADVAAGEVASSAHRPRVRLAA
jgi:RNA polymerase sigma-70 factor (ECF subfamily)